MEITAAHPLVQVGSQLDDRQAETDVNLQAGDGRFKDKTPLFVAAYGSHRRKTGEWRCSSRQFATWTSRAFASAEPNCHRMLQKSSRVGSQDHRRKGRGACPHLGTTSGLDKGRIRNQEGKGWNTQQLAFRWKNRSNWNPRLNTARSTSPSDACNWELLALSSCHAPMLFIVSTCLALRARQADKMKSRASCPSDLCPKCQWHFLRWQCRLAEQAIRGRWPRAGHAEPSKKKPRRDEDPRRSGAVSAWQPKPRVSQAVDGS